MTMQGANTRGKLIIAVAAAVGTICCNAYASEANETPIELVAAQGNSIFEFFDGVGKNTIVSMLNERGLSSQILTNGDEWAVQSQTGDTRFLIIPLNCLQSQDLCETLSFHASWSGTTDALRRGALIYNQTRLYGRGYYDGDVLVYDMVADVSKGVSRAHLNELLRIFVEQGLPDFIQVVGEQDAASTIAVSMGAPEPIPNPAAGANTIGTSIKRNQTPGGLDVSKILNPMETPITPLPQD